ncbi:MAG: enoyl-CoA hydratase-related protein [Dehalococcoidia bacterium]
MQGTVEVEERGHVLLVTLAAPGVGADTSGRLLGEHLASLRETVDGSVRVVVVTGSADAFHWGASDTASKTTPGRAVSALQVPVIAAIAGDCFDGGLELALACDLRIAAEDARFAIRQVQRGGLPMDGGVQRLARLVGRAHALRMLLTGDIIGTEEARRIGLVQQTGGLEAALALAEGIAQAAPVATAYTKEAVHQGMELPLSAGLRLEADLSFLLHSTSDRSEGLDAFRDRRKPHFEGR